MLRDSSFGPSSPITTFMPSPPSPEFPRSASPDLDDVWGSAPSSPTLGRERAVDEPSDIPRLRAEHSTAGYRDGLGEGKAQTMQAGFDEGFSLGAVVGLRVGAVLGTLEGICAAVLKIKSKEQEDTDLAGEKERMKALVVEAREALKTENVFGVEYWGKDGIWKFKVEGEEGEVTFNNVADAHPLLQKWELRAKEEAGRWRVDLGVLERVEVNRLDDGPLMG
jgi:hypothetical protein